MPSKEQATADPAANVQWQDVEGYIGEEWDFERADTLIGHFVGTTKRNLVGQDGRPREQSVHMIAPTDNPDRLAFVWGSYQLDRALGADEIQQGSLVRIQFMGRRTFSSDDGPRQVKEYRIQVATS